MAVRSGYSSLQILLHWLIAILVVVNWWVSEGTGSALRRLTEGESVATPVHVYIGLVVLALVLVRVAVRLVQGAPQPPASDPPLLRSAANWGHLLIYALLIGIPLGGAVAWFGQVRELGDVHALAANLLLLIAGGHAVVALWHHYGKKDGLLLRMMRPG